MYKLKLIRGRSYTGIVKADYKNPFVEVADKAVADALIAKGRFILISPPVPDTPNHASASNSDRENPAVIRKMTLPELNAYAAELGVDTSGCKNNNERAAVIIAALEKKKNDSGGGDNNDDNIIKIEDMTEEQLDAYAVENDIALDGLNSMAEKLAKVKEADGVNKVNFDEG